MPTLLVGI